MTKRNLFEELSQGFQDLEDERKGKLTLKQHKAALLETPDITSREQIACSAQRN